MLKNYNDIKNEAIKKGGGRIAIAGAEGKTVLNAVKIASDKQIILPILIGNKKRIIEISGQINFNIDNLEIHDVSDEKNISEKAVQLVHDGHADGLMKGKISTPTLLKSVLNKKYNLKTDSLLTHIALLEIPTYHKLLMITDGGMVINPTFEQKIDIIKNGAAIMNKLGIEKPKVAVLAAIEKVNQDMPETVDAEKLARMSEKECFKNIIVEGPLAVDIALSERAAKIKGVNSKIAGNPDIFLVPNIASGNISAKGIWHLARAKIGGLIVGTRKPIILLSRSDDTETKLNSIALAVVTS